MQAATLSHSADASSDSRTRREAMVASQLRTNEVIDPAVVRVVLDTPREAFVPSALREATYIDRAIPLGGGRALNPALTTARLIADAGIRPGDRVLVIGGASGYAAALIAGLGAAVTAVDEDGALVAMARAALDATGTAVELVEGPLAEGAPGHAPFDAMVVDGAIAALPAALNAQLRPGARIAFGIDDRGVTRLARAAAIAAPGTPRPVAYVDLECVALPGFAAAPSFSF